MMSHRVLSELHIITQKPSVNGEYYPENILKLTCMNAVNRTSDSGTILERALLENMSQAIFMQDGAPARTAKLTQVRCTANLPRYWAKVDWPNLWAILGEKLSKLPEVCTLVGTG